MYKCVCVCVCVRERERDRQTDRERERDRESWIIEERERSSYFEGLLASGYI